jgi:hypothetical protein
MLPAPEFNARVIAFPLLAAEIIEQLAQPGCKLVCISAVPPHAAAHAGHLCKRLKKRFPDLKVVVALWMTENSEKLESRLRDAGVDVVVTRLPDAIDKLRELQQYKPQPKSAKSGSDPESKPDSKPEQPASRRA